MEAPARVDLPAPPTIRGRCSRLCTGAWSGVPVLLAVDTANTAIFVRRAPSPLAVRVGRHVMRLVGLLPVGAVGMAWVGFGAGWRGSPSPAALTTLHEGMS